MRKCHLMLPSFERWLVLLTLAVTLCGITPVLAEPVRVEPAEGVRLILSTPVSDLAKRDRLLKARIQALERLGELARALVLREWRDEDQDYRVAAVDRPNRLSLARRFEQAVRDVLGQGDDASRLAVLRLLAEMGTTTHGVGTKHGIARSLGSDLVELTWRGEAGMCAAALQTLGQIDPEPEVALSAFSGLLSSEDPSLRLAAADGLVCWIRTLAILATRSSEPDGVAVSRADFVSAGRSIVPLAARGLRADQPEIRRRSAQAIGYVATALHTWVLAARSLEAIEEPDSFQHRTEQLAPLMLALKDEWPALMHALADADGEVRYRVGWALEDMAIPREMLMQQPTRPSPEGAKTVPVATVRPSTFFSISSSPGDGEQLQLTVQALAAQLSQGDLQARRSALDTLESLGQDGALATAELVGALGDPDKFVRWAAARTLGKITPGADETIALRLAQLLTDDDLDVRLAAATALERLGPAAKPAIADLCRTVGSTDAELRLTALRVLGAIGAPDAYETIPDAAVALRDADLRVRLVAAQVLGRFGPAARQAVPALCQALQDGSPDVQKAAGEALLNILRPGKK